MKNCRKLTLLLIMFVMLIAPIFTGCSFSSLQLDTPDIVMHTSNKCITWRKVDKAKRYEVYCNDELVVNYTAKSEETYIYDFTNNLTKTGDYEFYVVAVGNSVISEDSIPSEKVTYKCSVVPVLETPETNTVVDAIAVESEENITFSISGTRLTFLAKNIEADSFELYMYSTITGLKVYPISKDSSKTETGWYTIDLQRLTTLYDTIYAIRIGVVRGEEHIVCSKIKYLNSNNVGDFTKDANVYLFDGAINDTYIETLNELRNLIYYNFIYRTPIQRIQISSDLETLIYAYYCYGNISISDGVARAVTDAFDHFFETRDAYSITVRNVGNYQYEIDINYDDGNLFNNNNKPEPENTLKPTEYYYEDIEWETFYDTCGYTMRDSDPKYVTQPYEFVSDRQFLYTEVESSEELYWAVENRITPICKTGSSAENVYNIAKNVLNSIISDNMSDYEKVLSIFDWVCKETSYDYCAIQDNAYNNCSVNLIPAFYLEGVFVTGYAVCDGFSKAYSLLCNMEGIFATRVTGEALAGYDRYNNEIFGGHAWNKVKLDIDPNDNDNSEKYYAVDITWTELVGSSLYHDQETSGNEISSHEYFLLSDDDITTHIPYKYREKNLKLQATERYDYYENTTFTFNAKDYGLLNTNSSNKYDLVMDSSSDIQALFYYMLVEGKNTMEVVLDYDYMVMVNQANGGSKYDSYNAIVNRVFEKMRTLKFNEQVLRLHTNGYQIIKYNSRGDEGCIVVFEQDLQIDAELEPGHLLQYLAHYKIFTEDTLYIDKAILKAVSGDNELIKAQNLFKNALLIYDIDMELEYLGVDPTDDTRQMFNVKFFEKS